MINFSEIDESQVLFKRKKFFIIRDKFPVSPGHLLIISSEEKKDYFELDPIETEELQLMIHKCKEIIESEFKPDGYNIGMNCGEAAGQTVFRFHCHVIPRYLGDMDNPKGGVRHCVVGKGYYGGSYSSPLLCCKPSFRMYFLHFFYKLALINLKRKWALLESNLPAIGFMALDTAPSTGSFSALSIALMALKTHLPTSRFIISKNHTL